MTSPNAASSYGVWRSVSPNVVVSLPDGGKRREMRNADQRDTQEKTGPRGRRAVTRQPMPAEQAVADLVEETRRSDAVAVSAPPADELPGARQWRGLFRRQNAGLDGPPVIGTTTHMQRRYPAARLLPGNSKSI